MTGIAMFRVILSGSGGLLLALLPQAAPSGSLVPPFGRDTVLVWKIQNQEEEGTFVVRIAQFLPDRYIEWEDAKTQGTIFMTSKAVTAAHTFVNARLFEGGVDTRGKDATTLWLSQRLFRDIKEKRRVRVTLDGVDAWMTFEGSDQLPIEINRSSVNVPVIKVKDERGSERWFLDLEDNALLVKHMIRAYDQTLASITTDRPNTLRWIKGKKLANPH